MKTTLTALTLSVLMLGAFAPSALAGPKCRTIESPTERLACYDAASPPRIAKPTAVEKEAAKSAEQDPLAAENARTDAKLRSICRGC